MGRRAKPAALKEAQGNPGHRKIAREPKLNRKRLAIFANAVKIAVKAAAQDEGVKAYAQVEASLRAMNFIRQSDETLLLRYRRGWMRWWNASIELTFGSEVYECAMTGGVGTCCASIRGFSSKSGSKSGCFRWKTASALRRWRAKPICSA